MYFDTAAVLSLVFLVTFVAATELFSDVFTVVCTERLVTFAVFRVTGPVWSLTVVDASAVGLVDCL